MGNLDVRTPEIPVSELMEKIKAQTQASNDGPDPIKDKHMGLISAKDIKATLQEDPDSPSGDKSGVVPFKNRYELSELLGGSSEIFVRNAYRAILQREPEPGGADLYVRNIRNGVVSRIELLGTLRFSSEGKRQPVPIKGLRLKYVTKKLFKIHVIGYALRWLVALLNLPVIVRNIERFHASTHYRLDKHEDELNHRIEKIDAATLQSFWDAGPAYERVNTPSLYGKASSDQPSHNKFYSAFENVFYNGAIVRAKQANYLPYLSSDLTEKYPVLDCGCGRGEFLSVLAEHRVAATGVDTNSLEIARLKNNGFNVAESDLLSHLKNSNSTHAAISAFQVVEHLEMEYLTAFLRQAHKHLAHGGTLILETVNPHSPYALSNFYQDPTHVKPLPPELLQFLVEWYGFVDVSIVYSSLIPAHLRVHVEKRMNYQDYAVIGYRE